MPNHKSLHTIFLEQGIKRALIMPDMSDWYEYILISEKEYQFGRVNDILTNYEVPARDSSIFCRWCGDIAHAKTYRTIDDVTGSSCECLKCLNLSTKFLLERRKKYGN